MSKVTTTMIYDELKSLRKEFNELKKFTQENMIENEKNEWKKAAFKKALEKWDDADELIKY